MNEDFETAAGGICELCGRAMPRLTRHHLIPRTRHKNKRTRKIFERAEMKERIAWLCRPCHRNVHAAIDNKELAQNHNTLESLSAHPEIEKFTNWIHSKPAETTVPFRKPK